MNNTMREIIFRGRRVDNREWVEGDLVHDTFNGASRNIAIGIQEKGCYPVEVFPKTVGQFTGLLDKDGKKIFEGDVVQGIVFSTRTLNGEEKEIKMCGVVFYDYHEWSLKVIQSRSDEKRCGMVNYFSFLSDDGGMFKDIEVIGSIHTTPELLK